MRSDMGKVLVERPRGGGRSGDKGYRKARQRIPVDEMPSREVIKARSRGGSKWTEYLDGPIPKFLRANVGRPWDLVHSEICEATRGRYPTRDALLKQVYRFVERHVVLIDGVPCHGHGYAFEAPLKNYGGRYFYICPATGLLWRVPDPRSRSR